MPLTPFSCHFFPHTLLTLFSAHDHPDGSTGKYRPAFLDHFDRKEQNEQNNMNGGVGANNAGANNTPPMSNIVNQQPQMNPVAVSAAGAPGIVSQQPLNQSPAIQPAAALGPYPFPRGLETIDMNFVSIVCVCAEMCRTKEWINYVAYNSWGLNLQCCFIKATMSESI